MGREREGVHVRTKYIIYVSRQKVADLFDLFGREALEVWLQVIETTALCAELGEVVQQERRGRGWEERGRGEEEREGERGRERVRRGRRRDGEKNSFTLWGYI